VLPTGCRRDDDALHAALDDRRTGRLRDRRPCARRQRSDELDDRVVVELLLQTLEHEVITDHTQRSGGANRARAVAAATAPEERCRQDDPEDSLRGAEPSLVIGDHLVFERLKEKLDDDPVIELVGSLPSSTWPAISQPSVRRFVERGVQRVVIAPASGGQHEEAMSLIRAVREMGAPVSVYAGVLEVIASSVEFETTFRG